MRDAGRQMGRRHGGESGREDLTLASINGRQYAQIGLFSAGSRLGEA
jgi:hypothetical protein